MFVALAAFLLQGVLVSVSQAKAAVGIVPEPAVTLSGSVHYHDQLAGLVHSHAGDTKQGHVHDGPDLDDDSGPCLAISMFASSIAWFAPPVLESPFDLIGFAELPAVQALTGIEPDALTRPPSTLSIA